jgi:hypothetical protein
MTLAVPSHVGSIDGALGISSVVEGIEKSINSPTAAFATDTSTASFTATVVEIAGTTNPPNDNVYLALTGTASTGVALTLPTVAALAAALPSTFAGQSWILRIYNNTTQTVTVTTSTGWTLTGTMTILNNVWRDFVITMTSATAAVIQNVGSGTAT